MTADGRTAQRHRLVIMPAENRTGSARSALVMPVETRNNQPMRSIQHRVRLFGFALALAGALAVGCNRNKGEDASADPASAEAAFVEERDEGKLEWIVQPDGKVRVKVTVNEGGAPALSGALLVDGQSYSLTADGMSLSGEGPKLSAELTNITYSLKVGDNTWDGTLHVPPGGTKELVAVPTISIPEGTKGPNGGVVDVIGDQRVEIVTDEKTGEVRVYFLDENLKVIPVGSSTAVIAFQQQQEEEKK